MDRQKLTRWDTLLPICLALASGCDSPGTSSRTDRQPQASQSLEWQAASAEPRRLPSTVHPIGFRAQNPSDSAYPPPQVDLGPPSANFAAPSQAWLRAGQSATQAPAGDLQPIGPALTAESVSDPNLDFAVPEGITRLPIVAPAEMRLLPSDPIGDDAARAGQPSAGQSSARSLSVDTVPTIAAPQQQLPWADEKPRSAEMEAIAQSADGLVRQGFRLAERGAVYSARLKFFAALSLVARSLDMQQQTQIYTRSLVTGREALAEAWDFRASGLPIATDMARIVAAHRTNVLAQVPLESLSPVSAQQRYFSYAQEQLALAAGREPVGSLALYGLGKTAAAVRNPSEAPSMTIAGEQMACYQAALMVDSRNFRAAHELGVLMAENGRPETARDLFLRSLAISENAATWRNLALVWGRLGETDQAAQADRRADHLMNTRLGAVTGGNLRWVDPETFARMTPPSDGLSPAVAPPAAATAAPPKKRVAQWPWKQESRQ